MSKKNNKKGAINDSILGVDSPKTEKVETEEVETKNVETKKVKTEKVETEEDTYIMRVTHLSWGTNKSNHFYSKDKPEISFRTMGKKHGKIITEWLEARFIELGKYE